MNSKPMTKVDYMRKAIELANKGSGWVNPNPLVGAIIVKDGRIIGEGYHQKFGEPHAEVNAFLSATEDVEGADMYVTLEPCSHHGKTPPCALKIIEKKIKNVYISHLDPNPLVSGRGIKMLMDAGIHVEVGILKEETETQNEVFFHYIKHKRPYVIMKYAMTLDGKIATFTGDSKWITNEKSRQFVHELRHRYMGIMVGVNTVIKDDPHLDARRHNLQSRQPIRIIIDPDLITPLDRYVITSATQQTTLLVIGDHIEDNRITEYQKHGVVFIKMNTQLLDLNLLMLKLGEMHIDSIFVEGGSFLHGSLLEQCIVNKAYIMIAPKMIGGKDALTPVGGKGIELMADAYPLVNIKYSTFDQDIMIEGYFKKTQGEIHEN
ncbi:MAG: bifunctional diaminohydroxyphosphoribosylaminopyrimidine deaminase/5-amino-6-(5-phosphoribosylamino)uracil reductase RibD [Acholeplasmataceae bacterium]|jgi:diaminohydroxyphosphoribosylaminopyrimidine deaminase/5-amino-6-(5-phosphoribosylamino)uracil reductase|nr:bifunctional diaminohydroxyphosphoribosylaminopyrimidine deaminase/5-amino-6-(5-phosphoribosylamino)uracil reductase RibD [Acholeplasmataceae bacterium]